MAYVDQKFKAKVAPVIKALLKKYGLRGSLSVKHHTTLILTVSGGGIDFIDNYTKACRNRSVELRDAQYLSVNCHWAHEHFTGSALEFIKAAIQALKGTDYFDKSDSMTDYFHVSHYIGIEIGKWDKPYQLDK